VDYSQGQGVLSISTAGSRAAATLVFKRKGGCGKFNFAVLLNIVV
jgi:hypothetical protein